jgi:hypothetical protein
MAATPDEKGNSDCHVIIRKCGKNTSEIRKTRQVVSIPMTVDSKSILGFTEDLLIAPRSKVWGRYRTGFFKGWLTDKDCRLTHSVFNTLQLIVFFNALSAAGGTSF